MITSGDAVGLASPMEPQPRSWISTFASLEDCEFGALQHIPFPRLQLHAAAALVFSLVPSRDFLHLVVVGGALQNFVAQMASFTLDAGWLDYFVMWTHVQGHGKAKKMDSGVFLPQPPSWHCFFTPAFTGYSILVVSAAALAASTGIITSVFQFMVLVCVLVQRILFTIVENYDRVAAAFVSVKTQIVAAARLVSAVARSASFSIFTLVINGTTWSMGTTILSKGSSYAAIAAATPRVDVEKTPQAAAAPKYLLASSGHVWTEFRGLPAPGEKFLMVEEEGKHGGGNWEKLDSFFVFVVSLGGSSVQVRVEGSDSYESLAAKVAAKVSIPECHWYLTFSGKDLRHVLRPTSVLHRDSTIRMCSRLLGGAPLQPTSGE